MDRNGLPVAYDLFPGNESEKVHMRPIINRVKERFETVVSSTLQTEASTLRITSIGSMATIKGITILVMDMFTDSPYAVQMPNSSPGCSVTVIRKTKCHPMTAV